MESNTEPNIQSLKRIRLAVFILYFCQGFAFSSWASRIPDIKTSLGLNDAAWGTVLLMIPIGQICGMTLSGFLVSKLGSKRILPIALIGYAIMLISIGLSQNEYTLIISLIIFGFFGNFCNISINTQGVNIESKYNKPIMASFHGGWSLAGLTGASIGLLMSYIKLTPAYHFMIVSIIIMIAFIFNYRYLQPDSKKEKRESSEKKVSNRSVVGSLILLGIVAFCGMAAEGAMADWSGLYLIDVVGIKENLAPIGLTAYMITMASGRFVIDKATQRWGNQRIIQCGGSLIAIGLFMSVLFPNIVTTIIGFMIIGFGTCGIVPTIYSIAGKQKNISTSISLTIVSSVSFLGFLMGPPVIGYIAQASNLRYSYALIGIFGICIVILASTLNIFKNKQKESTI